MAREGDKTIGIIVFILGLLAIIFTNQKFVGFIIIMISIYLIVAD